MTQEIILTNALLVLPGQVLPATLVLRDGRIAEIDESRSSLPFAIDCRGDFLLPGIVDVHTDNLERQVLPRTNARWPSRSALISHDAQCAAAGITTVLDALCVGDMGPDKARLRTFREGIADLDALAGSDVLKTEHYLHMRCELPGPDMLEFAEPVLEDERLRMVSLMDHTPGTGQFASTSKFRDLMRADGFTEAETDAAIAGLIEARDSMRQPNRDAILARLAGSGIALASHDDRTPEEIAENASFGITIAEFPVTLAAARAAKAAGMQVIAGAPNLVRGGSHSGNVAVAELLSNDLADCLASDYVPASLVEAVFAALALGISLPDSVAKVTEVPARMVGLADRGRLQPGLRADIVRVRLWQDMPVVREVYRAGERIA